MSKSGKAAKHEKRMKERRAKKAAKAAAYRALAGTSKKNKRIVKHNRKRVSGIYKHAHIMSNCGNPGCSRCYPALHRVS